MTSQTRNEVGELCEALHGLVIADMDAGGRPYMPTNQASMLAARLKRAGYIFPLFFKPPNRCLRSMYSQLWEFEKAHRKAMRKVRGRSSSKTAG